MLIQARAMYYGPGPGFGYVLQEGAIEPESDSIRIPGPLLVLRQGEPVAITLVNRLPTHTAVHWHGMELDSYYDGVAGWSGAADHTAPMIAPQDSFIARFTPPRAGTFIYHAHITDHVQLARGLYGAMLVMPPNQPYVPESDHVVIVGFGRPNGKASMLVNGSESPLPLPRIRTGTQRLRLINIAPENNAVITLSAASEPISWRAIAKDGFQFPAARRRVQPARVHIFPGETYDFEFESSADVVVVRLKNPTAPASVDDLSLQLRVRR
ncbi:MAG: multicopper oxidase domain-containing protein [Gemmatimonas sp.]